MPKSIPLQLLQQETFAGSAWHGPNLRTSLIGVTPAQAAWSPGPGRPSIWQILLHCSYWKHRVWQRITGRRARFPHRGKDWHMPVPEPTAEAWNRDREMLGEIHARLTAAVEELAQRELESVPDGQARTRMLHVVGIMLHDTYHAGQIRLLRRLYDVAPGEAPFQEEDRSGPDSPRADP